MGFKEWVPIVGGISGIVSLLLVLVFGLFPSTRGTGDRLWAWLCTYGPLWRFARVLRAKALGRLSEQYPGLFLNTLSETEERADAAWEMFALLAPVRQRHRKWFMQGYIDDKGVKQPYRHRFLGLRIAWSLFWHGEPYRKFQVTLRELRRFHKR